MHILKSNKKIIGITLGDPAGIGPEIIAKAISKTSIRKLANFVIIGDYNIYNQYSKGNYSNCSFVDIQTTNSNRIKQGKPSKYTGEASLKYLKAAIELIKDGTIYSLVTAPVSKEAICLTHKEFRGHTELFAQAFGIKNIGMLFVAKNIKLIIATRHIPIKKVSKAITKDKIYQTISITYNALKNIFKIKNPIIGVCGLNPHAGEGGNIGDEEINKIIPAIKKANKQTMKVLGPIPADTIFANKTYEKFDAIVAMYHDQGLAGIKTMCFSNLVNMTIGLPFIRTSPAHGTAFDIAGKDIADISSMCEAIKLASS